MDIIDYNKLGMFGIVDIAKLIITNLELDELKELVVVSKYFNTIVNQQFPKLRKTLVILDEHFKAFNIITENWDNYSNIRAKQFNRKLYEFILRLLRKNEIILVSKIIKCIDNKKEFQDLIKGSFYYKLFEIIILEDYTNEHCILRNLIKISSPKMKWSRLTDCFINLSEDLEDPKIENIILITLNLLKAAIFINNENFIITLIKSYYEYDLYDHNNKKTDVVLFELNHLIKSSEESYLK